MRLPPDPERRPYERPETPPDWTPAVVAVVIAIAALLVIGAAVAHIYGWTP